MARGSFDELIRQETRKSSRDDGQSARDRAARRANVESGKNPNPRTSTAYKPAKTKPRAGATDGTRRTKPRDGGDDGAKRKSSPDPTLPDNAPTPYGPSDGEPPVSDSSWWPWLLASLIPGYKRGGKGGGGGGGGPDAPKGPGGGGDQLPMDWDWQESHKIQPPGEGPLPFPPAALPPPTAASPDARMQPQPTDVPLVRTGDYPDPNQIALPAPRVSDEDIINATQVPQLPAPAQVPIDVPTEDIAPPQLAKPRVRTRAPTLRY